MPGLDGTGPMGQGSGTGRRLGRCYSDTKNNEKAGVGLMSRGRGCGRGFGGRGFRRNWKVSPNDPGDKGKE